MPSGNGNWAPVRSEAAGEEKMIHHVNQQEARKVFLPIMDQIQSQGLFSYFGPQNRAVRSKRVKANYQDKRAQARSAEGGLP